MPGMTALALSNSYRLSRTAAETVDRMYGVKASQGVEIALPSSIDPDSYIDKKLKLKVSNSSGKYPIRSLFAASRTYDDTVNRNISQLTRLYAETNTPFDPISTKEALGCLLFLRTSGLKSGQKEIVNDFRTIGYQLLREQRFGDLYEQVAQLALDCPEAVNITTAQRIGLSPEDVKDLCDYRVSEEQVNGLENDELRRQLVASRKLTKSALLKERSQEARDWVKLQRDFIGSVWRVESYDTTETLSLICIVLSFEHATSGSRVKYAELNEDAKSGRICDKHVGAREMKILVEAGILTRDVEKQANRGQSFEINRTNAFLWRGTIGSYFRVVSQMLQKNPLICPTKEDIIAAVKE